ncbi:L-tyrosine/L-tryptophan isonitrile synthase family protein [Streptomyces griseofuscus]|uniref:L-tyrosine/L-tryptophan isonitrile synthase family protein n=1 Tax=Streptomyces griseofuscus TaxID=146922 RepID=UPI003F513E9E
MRGVGHRVSRSGCGVVRTGGARRTSADWTGTRSALQRACRQRAYGVIQRGRAWGTLIAEHHPRAVRLSITGRVDHSLGLHRSAPERRHLDAHAPG